MDGPEVCFYDVGTVVEKVKREPDGTEAMMSADYEELGKRWQRCGKNSAGSDWRYRP